MIQDEESLLIKDNKKGKLLTGYEEVTHHKDFL
jgi:hypothetical protein